MSLTTWLCPCGTKRIVECNHSDGGIPACPQCKQPMERERVELIPGLAKALALIPIQESEIPDPISLIR